VRAYFDKNHAVFDKPAQIRARHILSQICRRRRPYWRSSKPAATGPLWRNNSRPIRHPRQGRRTRLLRPRDDGEQFEDAAFGAKVGQIVGPVKSPFGYHIIQVEEKKPPTKASYASVQAQIRTQLTQQQEAQQIPVFLQNLRQTARIDVYDDRYKDAFPPPLPTPGASEVATPAASAAAAASAAPAPAASK